jgi:hypothetical protein
MTVCRSWMYASVCSVCYSSVDDLSTYWVLRDAYVGCALVFCLSVDVYKLSIIPVIMATTKRVVTCGVAWTPARPERTH